MKRVHLIISGFVQGVGYRAWCKRIATHLGVVGWVKNREDGTVEAVAESKKELLLKFIEECKKGPDVGYVEDMKVRWEEPVGEFTDFQVVY